MNKLSLATTLVLLPTVSVSYAFANDDSGLTREQQAAKTEVWEPVPEVVTFDENGVPSDAIKLLGDNLSAWESVKEGEAAWSLDDGVLTVKPGTGDIKTKASFCDVQLHVEWKAPTPDEGMEGQQRNNSGVFLQQRYEVQVLDSYDNKTYPNGQAASVYKQTIPLVNATKAPNQWQTYDIIFKAPTFNGEDLSTPGYVTVIHNGVVVQNHTEIQGTTEWIGAPKYKAHGCAPIQLQDHGNLVSFKNIWIREL
ncbi:large, multifunctional secreted protein [Alteromonas sp. KUL42]|uniref:3-keto-disaccharide hydrolase n=1 Tax=Alteromonas sp. KUL42 TaxID=2480797 RepID=UPI00103617F9|nr:DUF1080 domain-containing protein [Alteromonas sp. KUL42]TAP35199.1 DUF1080 domain-containing protein [Alteromonas sp. KUL42]GEA07496.1 large, multifunctional secreted protein [Alteromonas sp. KUL42]